MVSGCGTQTELSAVSQQLQASTSQSNAVRSGAEMLEFSAKTIDGKDFNGVTLRGRPTVLWFWTSWCPLCQSEAPVVSQLARSHPDVTFVGVAGLDQLPAMREFVDKYQEVNGFTQLADVDGTVWSEFGITQQPAFAFIQPNGGIDVVRGPWSELELNRRIATLSG